MADSRDFIQELLLSSERTALLYHLSFVCLGKFPKLEYLIRKQASETHLLFRSSEAVLMKCVDTSSNLVTSLFPLVTEAAENNKPVLAVKYLENARTWINDIIRAVDDILKRYDQQAKSVGKCRSDVFIELKETEENLKKHTYEMKALEDALVKLELELRKIVSENNGPRNQEWDIKIRLIDLQMKLANCKIQQGEIPSPDHLKEVQQCLYQIQQILVDLKEFWEKVSLFLYTLKEKTFAGEVLIEELEDLKEEFLESIEEAKQYWKRFGESCQRAQDIFSVQSKSAYKLQEINPSSLSQAEWNKQYESIMEKLKKT
ncbi:uncharacterized protein LOC125258081 isoform X2 [Megalobrama amblycephala]|uniref:uncharacterized protein LOC125258081 isoform X2 n=1 Tax=Megalobrama amblycephala TaxID=75352 RepID=UPI00201434AA|nr:uncharacterized protein LOC125258081 isoform X2 [Megalobrama amblycephala]